MEVHVLRIGSRWADRSRPMIAASRGGCNKSNRKSSGLFKIFLNFFYFDHPDVRVNMVKMKNSRIPSQTDKAY